MRYLGLLLIFIASKAYPYTANQVQFEFLNTGRYRVKVYYTIPELREFRQAEVEFDHKKDAEKFYFDLLKGGDFYYPDPKNLQFNNQEMKPEPW